ncbi:MAG: TetR family transcriptional regulator [Porticoccaceae bacterium]|nr:MAG: TetR family transcriptional regulator [Porticoccaceae bacterium]
MAATHGKVQVARRMGKRDSEQAAAFLAACEEILREEGYGALSSRRVAERAGLGQRLLYYYFETMDALVEATFARLAARELARLQAAAARPRPLRELWDACIHTADSRLVAEFAALANRRPRLRRAVIDFLERSREIQVRALAVALAAAGRAESAEALALLGTSLALALNREAALGVERGHREAEALVAAFLDQLEPAQSATASERPSRQRRKTR